MEKDKKPSDTPNLDEMFVSIRSGMLKFPGKAKEAVGSALYYARLCVKKDIDRLNKLHLEELRNLSCTGLAPDFKGITAPYENPLKAEDDKEPKNV